LIGKSFPIAVVFCLFVKRNNLSIKAKAYCYLKKISTHLLTVLIICVIPTIEQEKTNSQKEA
jgi:hypothetical protein